MATTWVTQLRISDPQGRPNQITSGVVERFATWAPEVGESHGSGNPLIPNQRAVLAPEILECGAVGRDDDSGMVS
jgi:hypothetical protein